MKKFLCLLSLMILPLTSCTTVYIDVTVKPSDAKLAYWVGDIIDNEEIDQDYIVAGFEKNYYLDHNYIFEILDDGSKNIPKTHVYYSLKNYDDSRMIVSAISITDSDITIYGLSMNSSKNEIYDKLTSYGFIYVDGYYGMDPEYRKDDLTLRIDSSFISIYIYWPPIV